MKDHIMERITARDERGRACLPEGYEARYGSLQGILDAMQEKLAMYEDAEAEGRLLLFPVAPERVDIRRIAKLLRAEEPEPTWETCLYDQEEVHTDCTVQVLRNSVTGAVSVGWWKNSEVSL